MIKQLQLNEQMTNEIRKRRIQLKHEIEYFKEQLRATEGNEMAKTYLKQISLALNRNQIDEEIMKKVDYLREVLGTKAEVKPDISASPESLHSSKKEQFSERANEDSSVHMIKKPERRNLPFVPNSFKSKDSLTSVNLSYRDEDNKDPTLGTVESPAEVFPPLSTTVPVQESTDPITSTLSTENSNENLLDSSSYGNRFQKWIKKIFSCGTTQCHVCEKTDHITHPLSAFDLLTLLVSFALLTQTDT